MKELTLREAVELHRELWNWLAEDGMRGKRDWPRWKEIEEEYGIIEKLCFACHFDIDHAKIVCSCCFLNWKKDSEHWCGILFHEWINTRKENDWVYAERLAERIADLPIKPKYEEQLKLELGEDKSL